ncbi:hypothetical protein SporoP37_05310 [Sporosarcina sp. P37]|uniref:hypothetical protein n=1 Tax=unclassified Sporosarcina TaxID=2647733 RepID=UPI000A17D0FA|nr:MULTISPECIES: hypothetical protein [unclassified Sporosarcina]ARK24159.1 hypothetical protein SporoP37_05310 [Sporosarcina sp. P37]PID17422.1 hypothetical protein CSV62_13685 [Sporosarcina sp. P35]
MKKWLVWILVISVCLNLYQFGKDFWVGLYTPTEEDRVILGEMTQFVVESEEYRKIAETEKIYAITTGVDRNKGGGYPFHYDVMVKTDKESYIFYCMDKTCSDMEIGGWTYSRYSEDEPVLPLKK